MFWVALCFPLESEWDGTHVGDGVGHAISGALWAPALSLLGSMATTALASQEAADDPTVDAKLIGTCWRMDDRV